MFPGPYTQHFRHPWEHIPSPYHYYPNWEPAPIHMNTDSFNNQVEHDSCCNRSYPTGYCSLRPPYFHYQHPPQMYCHGPYPLYQNAYTPLFIPPHFDHARCDYDTNKNHCCGCPNHNSPRKEGSNVKIEEQNTSPTIDENSTKNGSLIQFPYNYYPMMWHPENSTTDGMTEKKTESLPTLNFKDNLKDFRQGQEESTHQGNNKRLQLPHPIFLLSGNGKPEEPVKDKKEIDATPKVAEDWPSKLKIVPLKLLGNENVVDEETKSQHSEKESKIKTIPVMHLDSSNGEKLSMAGRPEDVLKNSVAEEKRYDAEIKKEGKKQPSPQKPSKLPPVCLRVEPLPKKNGSNGKVRSPSLLSLKDKAKPHEGNLDEASIMNKKDSGNTTKDIKVIDMKGIEEQCGEKDGNEGGNKEEREDIPISQQRMIEPEREKVDASDNYKKQAQKKYSPEDAALLIQSAFRGFNVRRWKPLDKLQKIAQIRGKLNDVKSQIQTYEGSLELDVKQKVIINETIMNLLLQLDTIQGLLPSLREIRKSVARDLVCLQDKLDQLYGHATNEHEQGTQKKDESSISTSDASEITLTREGKDLPSAEMVPFGQADNISSAEGNASVNQDVVAVPPESELLDFVVKQQPDSDQSTKLKEMRASKEQDLSDVECDSKHENASISLLEANKQSLFEVVALNEQSESKKENNSEEDVTVIRNEESNDVEDAFVVSDELKAACEPDSLAAMHPIQSSDAWKEETQSVKEDSEMSEHSKTEAKLCVKSATIDTEVHNDSQELIEVSSEIPAAETSIFASTNKAGADESALLEASVCDTGLKESASYLHSESNFKDSSQEETFKEKKLIEDNEKLRQMLEKLLNAGEEQMGVIAELNERVKNLEKKISKRKKMKGNQKKLNKFSHSVVGKDKVMYCEKEASPAA